MPIEAVVADANVLLSAAVGKAALRVINEFGIEVHVARFNVEEVLEYLPQLAEKYELPLHELQLLWALLPLDVHEQHEYQEEFPGARKEREDRDPEDAHALALARTLRLPLWSNDNDLKNRGPTWYPTAKLLRLLEG